MAKWFRFKYWTTLLRRVGRLLVSPRVPVREKLLFLIPAVLYWVLPDALPLIPLDNIAVTMLLAGWFAKRMENKHFL